MRPNLIQCLAAFLIFSYILPFTVFAKAGSDYPFATATLVAPDIHVDRLTAVEQAVAGAKSSGTTAGC